MPLVRCPACGEDEALRGERTEEGALAVACESCGAEWERHTERRCGLCGSNDLQYTPEDVLEKARGNQYTPTGRLDAWSCYGCGGRNVTSDHPVPGDPADLRPESPRDRWQQGRSGS